MLNYDDFSVEEEPGQCYQNYGTPQNDIYTELIPIQDKCNLFLLKQQLISLFGYPAIQIESEKIISYLEGIEEKSEFDQKRMIRTLISFIGEVTSLDPERDKTTMIRDRIEQFLVIKGFGVHWTDAEWNEEVQSLFETQYRNPYYGNVLSKKFEYVNFFKLLDSPLPLQLRNLSHNCCSQVLEAKQIEDFKYLCNIWELKNVRKIRRYINQILEKLEEFRKLLIKIEARDYNQFIIIKQFEQLQEEVKQIIKQNLKFVDQSDEEIKKKNFAVDDQTEQNSFKYHETHTQTATMPISQEIRTKKMKKKQKLHLKTNIDSNFLFTLEQENSQEQSKEQISEDSSQDQIAKSAPILETYQQKNPEPQIILPSKCISISPQQPIEMQDKYKPELSPSDQNSIIEIDDVEEQNQIKRKGLQLINKKAPPIVNCLTIDYVKLKLQEYANKLDQLQLLGYPCLKLDNNRVNSFINNFNQFYFDKNSLILQIVSSIWETTTIFDSTDVIGQVRKQLNVYLQMVKLNVQSEAFENILISTYEKTAAMPFCSDFKIDGFSFDTLHSITNREFPKQIQAIQCLSSRVAIRAKSVENLKQALNIRDVQNIRIVRAFIRDLHKILEKIKLFSGKVDVVKVQGNNESILKQFMQLEQEYQSLVNKNLNFKLEQQKQSQQPKQQKQLISNCILVEDIDHIDKYFKLDESQEEGIEVEHIEIPKIQIVKDEEVEDDCLNQGCRQGNENQMDLATPNSRIFDDFNSLPVENYQCFNFLPSPSCNKLIGYQQFFGYDQVNNENVYLSPESKQFQYQLSFNFQQ